VFCIKLSNNKQKAGCITGLFLDYFMQPTQCVVQSHNYFLL